MAIVKMKRLRLAAVKSQKEELLKELMLLGCIEISDPGEPDEELASMAKKEKADSFERKSDHDTLEQAITLLDKYAPAKKSLLAPRPEISERELLDDSSLENILELANRIDRADSRIKRIEAEESHIRGVIETLKPWQSLDAQLQLSETETCFVNLGTLPPNVSIKEIKDDIDAQNCAFELYEVSSDDDAKYVMLVAMKTDKQTVLEEIRKYGFTLSSINEFEGTAAENIALQNNRLKELADEKEILAQEIKDSSSARDELKLCADRMLTKLQQSEGAEKLLYTQSTFNFEGWIPAAEEEDLAKLLNNYDCAWETEDPSPEEYPQVPIKLKNNKFTEPLNMVTEMYALPSYDGVDPNPLMAPFFIFFFGFMMADMGYGLLMMLISLIAVKKAKPQGATMRYMMPLMGWCGLSTFIMGALTGGFFGDMLPQIAMLINPDTSFTSMPALFSPLDDALSVLIGSLAIGLCQIFTGMAVSMYRQFKRGEVMAALCNEGAWFLVFILFGVGAALGKIKEALIAILVLLVLTQGYGKKGILGKLGGIGGSLYNNITGYFSDILSYSRLMALMLAGAVIAQVFNTLGAITGNVITFFIISMIGNTLNFALNLLGCYVHDMRLQCLEYFGRFYSDGGKAFCPLAVRTDFVRVIPNKKSK